jgi:hypothetical protein
MLRPEGRGGSLAILTSNHYARLKLLVAECLMLLAENRPQMNADKHR